MKCRRGPGHSSFPGSAQKLAIRGEMADEYEAGATFSDEVDLPEIVTDIRDQLNEVREGIQKLNEELWGPPRSDQPYEPDPVRRIRIEKSQEPLRKEEDRLMAELRELEPIIPPLMDPPHNGKLTQAKAKEILRHGEVHGHTLTEAQKGFFGLVASGKRPTRMES